MGLEELIGCFNGFNINKGVLMGFESKQRSFNEFLHINNGVLMGLERLRGCFNTF